MNIYDQAKYFEGRYRDGSVQLYEGLEYKQRELIKTADFYALSRYASGQKDDLGRDKPFFNVVNFRVTLAKTATEFDIKDFRATSDNSKAWAQTMLLNREMYKWMKQTKFSTFLNKYAYVRPKYGGVLYKKVLKDGELYLEVCDWRNTLTDQVDIIGSPIIEEHYLSPLDFINKRGTWNDEAIDRALELFEEKREQQGDDEAPMRLKVHEITGVFDHDTYLEAQGKEPQDATDRYYLQKHFLLVDEDDEDCEYVLYSQKPKELDYRYLAWEEVTGRGLGRGVIEESEEGQVWVNDLVIKQKNTMDLAGKVTVVTDADNVAGNMLEVDDGKVWKVEEGRRMEKLELAPAALGNFQNIVEQWENQLDKANSTFDANTGEQPPSGTPYSQTALLNQVAQRPFAFRQEEAGIDLEEAFNEWVIPHLINKLKGEHVLAEEYDEEELEAIDEAYGNKMARKAAKDMLLKMQTFTQEDIDTIKAENIEMARKGGAKRHVKIPEKFFDGWEGKVTLNITNEQENKAAVLTSLSQIMSTVSQSYNPQTGTFAILENPTLAKLFGTIVDKAAVGISPIELGIGGPQKPQAAPQGPATPSPVQSVTPGQTQPTEAPVA